MNIKAKPSKIFCKCFNGLNHWKIYMIFLKDIHGYSGCGLKFWIVLTTRKMDKKIHQIGQKRNYGNWLYLCLLGNNRAVIKRTTPKGDQKTNLMHNNIIIGSAVIKRPPPKGDQKTNLSHKNIQYLYLSSNTFLLFSLVAESDMTWWQSSDAVVN